MTRRQNTAAPQRKLSRNKTPVEEAPPPRRASSRLKEQSVIIETDSEESESGSDEQDLDNQDDQDDQDQDSEDSQEPKDESEKEDEDNDNDENNEEELDEQDFEDAKEELEDEQEEHEEDQEEQNDQEEPEILEEEDDADDDEVKVQPRDYSQSPAPTIAEKRKKYLLSADPKTTRLREGDDSTKRFKYLLSLTPLFRHFIDLGASKDPNFKQQIREIDSKISFQQPKKTTGRRRKTEKEEDAELLNDEVEEEETEHALITESPAFVKDGTLRDYQVQGLNWLISLYENRLSGILADEMGLGKTLQTISFLGYLRYMRNVRGPFIVIVPKSTLDNWRREFAKWTPDVKVVVLQGAKEDRAKFIQERLLSCDFDVLVTSFEMVIREKSQLKKFRWEYIIVDEAHRIKNEDSSLSQIIRLFYSRNRLLITGTPLQNNLHELWALLNFLLPDVFGDAEVFDEWFSHEEDDEEKQKNQDKVVQQLHQLLSPFLLRRVKIDVEKSLLPKLETNVYIGMSDMQVEWYKKLLEKDIDAVNGAVGKREGKTRLLNIVMQLRKCCNHPYLFDGAEPGPPYTTDEHLVFNSGKMIILDKMLKKFKEDGSRVLIFSQMSRLLDILEDYCFLRDYEYSRIDGSTSHEDRISGIDEFNAPDSDKFIFLLTTRAGGLGINLTTADIVILFDSDWNPQADLQAMDRAHRIGQKKQVKVFRFVTENAIEEKVLERAAQKLRLDQLVIQQGRHLNSSANSTGTGNSKDDLIGMIQHGAQKVFESSKGGTNALLDDDIDEILKRGAAKTAKLNAKFNQLGLDDVQNFTLNSSTYEWNGQNFKKDEGNAFKWINPSKRERKEITYSIENYYKDVAKAPDKKASATLSKLKAPKIYNIQDHQFFPEELPALLDREQLAYKKAIGYKFDLNDFGESDDEFLAEEFKSDISREEKRKSQQQKVDSVIPLTEEEAERKNSLLSKSFHGWTRRDFTNFIHGVAKYGKEDFKSVSKALGNKPEEEVQRYLAEFWQSYKKIDGYDKYLSQIEASEKKLAKLTTQQTLLNKKMENVRDPLEDLKIQYPPNNSKRVYSKAEDRFILYCVHKHGLFTENLLEKIKEDIMASDLFKFDWYLLSRTPQELGRRVSTLLLAVTKELGAPLKRKLKEVSSNSSTRNASIEPTNNGKRTTDLAESELPDSKKPKST